MTSRYPITLVGSEEPNGSRLITTKDSRDIEVLFSVAHEDLKAYVPNAGDTLVQDEDLNVTFEPQDGRLRYLYRQQPGTRIWIQEHGPFADQEQADRRAGELALETGIVYKVGICTSEDGQEVIQ